MRLKPFQLYEAKSWTGLTTENHIDNAFGREPQYLSKVIQQILDVNVGMSFVRWMDNFGTEYLETNQPYKWKLKGRDDRNLALIGCWEDELGTVAIGTNNVRPGVNFTRFYMDFPDRYFTVTSVIVGEKPDLYHLRVMAEPIQVGNYYRYAVQIVDTRDDWFVPIEELAVGTRWSLDYGLSERYLSKDGMDISFNTPFDMENRVSFMRQRHEVAGEMIDLGKNKPLMFAWKDDDGTTHTNWLSKMEFEFMKQFHKRLAHLIFYGKSTVRDDGTSTMKGTSGNVIDAGYGIREQFLPTNKHYFNSITLDYLTQVALDVTVGKIAREDRTFVIGTGEFGLKMLHQMVADKLNANDYMWAQDTTGRAFSWAGNDITTKLGQFVGVATINGINFKFMHFPQYDDVVRNKLQHPNGGVAESYRMTIMDFGNRQEPNIKKIRIKGREPQYTYIPGLRDPYNKGGMGKARMTASEVDGYVLSIADWVGGVVMDPTRVIEFIPSILR
jgi:hypothetical protein